ncbi:hypothetical protein HYALB_00011811 [Hymenoscyphus albidus]|uniref:FAD/NAD(P)-binding domain-containing protein n=1 Tax=Hymenoscyphus albidus TaxID=595503 RepID=A0A9N9LPG6_9HELO|nr:hypothetical protein HYALB_00011811 [Hymenoscyphus albidus]
MSSSGLFSKFIDLFPSFLHSNRVFPIRPTLQTFNMPSAITEVKPVRILVAGGSYGGLAMALNLLDLTKGKHPRFSGKDGVDDSQKVDVRIKVVDERDGYFHLIGSPLAFSSESYAEKFWVKYTDIPALNHPSISVAQGSVSKIDPASKIATIVDHKTKETYEEKYDYFVAASGLRRDKQVVPQELNREKYLEESRKQISGVCVGEGLKDGKGVVVIGGGAVGIEMASEIATLHPTQRVTLIHSRDHLLSSEPLPTEMAEVSLKALRETGVEVLLNKRVSSSIEQEEGKWVLKLNDGTERTAGYVIWAISNSNSTSGYLPKNTVDEEGLVRVHDNLHFEDTIPNPSYHFALGDIVKWSGIKRCGGAMHMGLLVATNLHQEILVERGTLKAHKFLVLPVVEPMMALACGKSAISWSEAAGVAAGEDVEEMFFGGNLGWDICWNYLQLGKSFDEPKKNQAEIAKLEEKVNDLEVKENTVNQEVGVEA